MLESEGGGVGAEGRVREKWMGRGEGSRGGRSPLLFFLYYLLILVYNPQCCNARKVNCSCVYSAYILKPVLSEPEI